MVHFAFVMNRYESAKSMAENIWHMKRTYTVPALFV
jgi:hypothetical protein